MKYYTIYKTINKINGKFYIGCHQTFDINDEYFGSGLYLKNAIKKYGIENFDKKIIAIFNNPEDMFKMESEIVNEDFVKRNDTYNIKEGGFGGWDHENKNSEKQRIKCLKGNKKQKDFYSKDEEWVKKKSLNMSRGLKKAHKEGNKNFRPPPSFEGKKHTEKTKRIIGEKNSIHQKGEKNSQYGTCWIYNKNLKKCKKINKNEIHLWLEKGWLKGRKMSFENM